MNYQKYAVRAFEKLKHYGSPITIKRSGNSVYNPSTNTYTDNIIEIKGFAICRNYNQHDVNGTNIQMGDVSIMASLDGIPKSNDSVVFGKKTYTVISVDVVNLNGLTDIFYNIQAR